jgi:hypothetical protein
MGYRAVLPGGVVGYRAVLPGGGVGYRAVLPGGGMGYRGVTISLSRKYGVFHFMTLKKENIQPQFHSMEVPLSVSLLIGLQTHGYES